MSARHKEAIRKKFALSRRAFLGGAGAIVALPYLRSFVPREVAAATPPPATRFFFYYQPTGFFMKNWLPNVTGKDVALPQGVSTMLSSLDPVRQKLLVVQGLGNYVPESVHESEIVSLLSCTNNDASSSGTTKNSVTVDQLMAQALGQYTVVPSLQLGLYDGGNLPISWASASQSLPAIGNPRSVFNIMFRGYDPTATAQQQAQRTAYDKSVIDYVMSDAQSLSNKLSNEDKQKLDEYFTSLREVENNVVQSAKNFSCATTAPADEPGSNFDRQKRVKDMMDLTVLAFKCDITRIVTFDFQDGNMSYPWLGFSDNHHDLSHKADDYMNNRNGQTDVTVTQKYEKIGTWHIEQYSYLVKQLDAISDDEGTILDNSMIYLNSEISFDHNKGNLPVLVAGGGRKKIKSGRFVKFDNPNFLVNNLNYDHNFPLADLYVTMMNVMGMQQNQFGYDGNMVLSTLLNS